MCVCVSFHPLPEMWFVYTCRVLVIAVVDQVCCIVLIMSQAGSAHVLPTRGALMMPTYARRP